MPVVSTTFDEIVLELSDLRKGKSKNQAVGPTKDPCESVSSSAAKAKARGRDPLPTTLSTKARNASTSDSQTGGPARSA